MNSWHKVSLDDCCQIVSGATPSTSEDTYWGGDICWATPKDLSELQGAYISDTPRKLTKAGLASCAATIMPPDSVLFSSRAPIGHTAINTIPMATNQGFKSFIPNKDMVYSKFLYYWLRLNRPYLESLGNGATFKEVSKSIVSRIEIHLPPISEQRRIAEVLDRAEALRAKRRAALAQLDTLTQAIFLDMFGDPSTNAKQWPLTALKSCTEMVQIGPFGSLLHQGDYISDGVPIVNPKHIKNGAIVVDKRETITELKFRDLMGYHLKPGDVVMGRRGEMGRCAIVEASLGPLLCGTGSLFLRPCRQKTDSVFLRAILSSAQCKLKFERMALGQTLPNLNSRIVEQFEIPLPPVSQQHEFHHRLNIVESQKCLMEKASKTSNDLFASLQHRAFRGEL